MTVPEKRAYRPDIDGLRAVAVLGVIFFHAGFQWIRGGYVGVDVFFVISGFLITGILLRELGADRFSLARFYERRLRRILPALLTVVAATLVACAAIMLADDLRTAARSAVGVLAFAANVLFWRGVNFVDATLINYFGQRLHEQPLIHTWSLGVEEQDYLLFPAGLIVAWRIKRSWVVPALVAGTVASLALSAVMTPRSPGVAFYLLPARIWELLAGGLLAWHAARPAAPLARPAVRELTTAAGLGLILIAMFAFDSETPFPGLYAVVPIAGAVLVMHSAPGTVIGRMLSSRAAVFIGLISYSAYLWHQPLFALARYASLSGEMDTGVALLLCVVTLLLATITWRYVETPFRDRRRVSNRALLWSCAIGLLAVATPAAMLAFGGAGGRRSPMAAGIVGQSMLSLFTDCNTNLQVTRGLGLGCLLDPSSHEAPSFLVVGDSQADSLYPVFVKFSRDSGRQGRLLQHWGCSPLVEITEVPYGTPGCLLMHNQALAAVAEQRIDRVILVSRFSYEFMPQELFERRFEKTIAAYAERGATVYIIMQMPDQPRFNRRAYLRAVLRQRFFGVDATPEVQRQSVSRAEHDQRQAFVNGVFAGYRDDPRVRFVEFTSALCDETTCSAGTTSTPYYQDDSHLNTTGALVVSDTIAKQLIAP